LRVGRLVAGAGLSDGEQVAVVAALDGNVDGYVLARIMKFETAWIRQLEKASTIDPQ